MKSTVNGTNSICYFLVLELSESEKGSLASVLYGSGLVNGLTNFLVSDYSANCYRFISNFHFFLPASGSKDKLPLYIRHKIALGKTKGILCLHERCQRRIIHRI